MLNNNKFIDEHPNTKEWSMEERERYYLDNKKLIYRCIGEYRERSSRSKLLLSDDDLFQEASIAFWKAFDNYDSHTTATFKTYAYKLMDNAIKEVLRKQNASKRQIDVMATSYDAVYQGVDDDEFVTGENMQAVGLVPDEVSIEDLCIRNELVQMIYNIMDEIFTETEQRVFMALTFEE